jgi:hypothetical protein
VRLLYGPAWEASMPVPCRFTSRGLRR